MAPRSASALPILPQGRNLPSKRMHPMFRALVLAALVDGSLRAQERQPPFILEAEMKMTNDECRITN
jgi:hypothetical protein